MLVFPNVERGGHDDGLGREAVAATAQRLDDGFGIGHGGVEFFTQVRHVRLDHVGVMLPVVVVEVLEEFLLADDLAGMVQQVFENVVLGGREIDERAVAVHGLLQGIEVDAERVECGMGCALAAADEGFGAGEEFAEVEGLGEVVVCAGVEQLDDGVLALFRGEDEDGGRIFAGAHAAQDAVAVELGQHQVEDHEVVAEIARSVVAGLAIGGPVDGKARAVAQGGSKIVGQPDFIFDEQDAHNAEFSLFIIVAARLNEAEGTRVRPALREAI